MTTYNDTLTIREINLIRDALLEYKHLLPNNDRRDRVADLHDLFASYVRLSNRDFTITNKIAA